jgi:hypothetical protein
VSQPTDRQGFDRQVRYGRVLGLVFCVAGFTTIGFGWNGAAKTALVDMQFPYLISGGLAGVALVLLGVGLLILAQVRSERLKLVEELQKVGSVISRAVAASPAAGASPDGRVVAGKSTYHLPGCPLVEGKSELDFVTVGAAKAGGLSPCRVCHPQEVGDAEADRSSSDTGTKAERSVSPAGSPAEATSADEPGRAAGAPAGPTVSPK